MSKIIEELEEKFTKYEVARILGARALQISMDAPLLLKMSDEELEKINFNPLEMAKKELLAEVLPITINRPLPKKRQEKLKKFSKKEVKELKEKELIAARESEEKAEKEIEEKDNKEAPINAAEIKADELLEKVEISEEKKIEEDAEIMELAKPDDETELEDSSSESEEV